jgi:glutathione synthase/RimK-type ligase-like ATP-grasp enzyme
LFKVASREVPIESLLSDGGFPLIVRPLGSHAGTNLEKIDTPAQLGKYLNEVKGEQFYLSRFVDYRSADGLFRKYRVALVGGKPFICHYAISERWMIHYLNAGMTDSAEKRAGRGCLHGLV